MDSDQRGSGRVDQLFAGYSTSSGMSALESTFEDAELHRGWEQALIHYVRLDSFGRDDPPPSAFTYITFDNDTAAILRRVRLGDSSGRNNAHVLIGPADILGAVALDLTRWDNWVSDLEHPALRSLTNQDLRVATNAADILDDAANASDDLALPLMGWVLSQPDVKLSYIGMDQERIVPTLRLFERVLKPLFSVERRIRNWSFSTYEVTDADQGKLRRPELIFLPKLPDHAEEIYHHRIFLDDATRVEGQYQQLAGHLIEKYRQLGCEQYIIEMNGAVGSIRDVQSRIQDLLNYGFSRQPCLPHSTYVAQTVPTPAPCGDQKTEPTWERGVAGNLEYGYQPSRASAVGPGPEEPPVALPRNDGFNDEEIVRQLAEARHEKVIDFLLAQLRGRITDAPATDGYRWGLIYRYKILQLLSSRLYLWDLIVSYGHVLEFAFGAGAKALHEHRYFDMVEGPIKDTKISLLFGCVVYYFVEDSQMGSRCTQLLHQRSGELKNIPLMPDVMTLSNGPSAAAGAAGWRDRLVALCSNSRVLILLTLLLLMSVAVVLMIFVV